VRPPDPHAPGPRDPHPVGPHPASPPPAEASWPAVHRPTDDLTTGSTRRSGTPGVDPPGACRWLGRPFRSVPGVCLLIVIGLGMFWAPLRGVRLGAMNGYGLISVLPVPTLVGAGVLTAAFLATLRLDRPRRTLLTVQIVIIAVSLHGLAPALEETARFPTTWQHAGLIEYITRTHGVDTLLDARFNWPAFFALVGFVTKAAGVDDLEPLLHWAPVATNLFFLGPLALILRTLRANWRARWFAAWLFPVANWVGQDYLSPQAFGYLLYLCWIAILVNWFRPPGRTMRKEGRRRTAVRHSRNGPFRLCYDWAFGPMEPGELPPRQVPVRERSVLFLLLVAIFLLATAAHQLTPFLMIVVTAGLVVTGRCTVRGLPILGLVIFAGWVSFMTRAYWAGHLAEIFGGVGRLGTNLSASVGGRITQGSPQLANVQTGRLVLAVLVTGLALLGMLRRRTVRMDDRVAVVLLIAPFTSFGLQSYGGEIALRTYFFMLPGACVLIAYLFFPEPATGRLRTRPRRRRGTRRLPAGLMAGVSLIMVFGFLLVRFGNETFEQIRPGDLKAFDVMLERHPKGPVTVVWLTAEDTTASGFPVMPWSHRDFERFAYPVVATSRIPAGDVLTITTMLREHGPGAFFVTTRGHEAYLELSGGLPAGYGVRLRAALSRSGDLEPVFTGPDAAVFALRSPPRWPDPPAPGSAPLNIGMTTWTPASIVYLPVLLGVLMARELRRLRLAPGERRRLRAYTVLAIPLLMAVCAIVVERFLTLN
jgi:hypothetical protein